MSKEFKKDNPVSRPEQSPKQPEIGPLREHVENGSNKLEKGQRSEPDLRRPTMETPIPPPPKNSNNSEG